jgi:hypothetical protein
MASLRRSGSSFSNPSLRVRLTKQIKDAGRTARERTSVRDRGARTEDAEMRPASPSEQASRSDAFAQRARGAAFKSRRTLSAVGVLAVVAGTLLLVPAAQAEFGITKFSNNLINHNGTPDTQAGSHPWAMVTEVGFTRRGVPSLENEAEQVEIPSAEPKDTTLELPPGLVGDPGAVPRCSRSEFLRPGGGCPTASAIGLAEVFVKPGETFRPPLTTAQLYNLVPPPGTPAEFGTKIEGVPVLLSSSIRSDSDDGIDVMTLNISQILTVFGFRFTTWGVPEDPSHDPERFCSGAESPGCPAPEGETVRPFLTLPSSCPAAPPTFLFRADSWQSPGLFAENTFANPVGLEGCNQLSFNPSDSSELTSSNAYSPTGLNFNLHTPTDGLLAPNGLGEPEAKKAVVTLPEGMSVNPSAGAGLGVCTTAELASEQLSTPPGTGCPNSAKVGTVEVHTPLLENAVPGTLYIAAPYENPFNSLLAIYMVVKDLQQGILLKLPGRVEPNPITGQLTTTFDNLPQLPFENFTLKFSQGQTSPLVSPPACGSYAVEADFTPHSDETQVAHLTSHFAVTQGVGGGACPSGGVPPFHPESQAGSYSNGAGSYSPFYVKLSRKDGEQEITHFSATLPPGLVGKLAGVAKCSDAAIAAATARTGPNGGREEEEHPSCPASSEIGHTIAEAGVGAVLAQAPGKVYLAGPYHGSPISIAAVTSADVGPFDLGTVVVRSALKVDPITAQVTVDGAGSDPIPHIIQGIPVHLRNIRVYVDRPNFTLNPTSCNPFQVVSTLSGSGANFVSSADDSSATTAAGYQAANCSSLKFPPALKFRLKGKTRRAGNPALTATVTYPKGGSYANIAAAQVTLPPSEFLEQGHIGTTCTRVQFAAGGGNGEQCPKASIYGHAKAVTPLLDNPIEGPVYLRSNGGERQLPDLVAALHGEDFNIDLVGFIGSVHQKGTEVSRIKNSFNMVPDAPVSSFTLSLFGGKKSLLANSTNICKGTHKATARFVGQNGAVEELHPSMNPQCGGKAKKQKRSTGGSSHR